MPAWNRLGASAWAAYSRQADLVQGIVIYPTLAFGAAVPTVIAAIILPWIGPVRTIAAVPIDLAVFLVVVGLLATIKAAPIMLGLRRVDNDDEVTVAKAFRGFNRWTLSQIPPVKPVACSRSPSKGHFVVRKLIVFGRVSPWFGCSPPRFLKSAASKT